MCVAEGRSEPSLGTEAVKGICYANVTQAVACTSQREESTQGMDLGKTYNLIMK